MDLRYVSCSIFSRRLCNAQVFSEKKKEEKCSLFSQMMSENSSLTPCKAEIMLQYALLPKFYLKNSTFARMLSCDVWPHQDAKGSALISHVAEINLNSCSYPTI